MSYSTLMVHMELEHSNAARLNVAATLAERFGTAVIGIAAADAAVSAIDAGEYLVLAEVERQRLNDLMSDAKDAFQRHFKARGNRIEWRSALESPARYLSRQVRAADLLVTGANDIGANGDLEWSLDAGDLVMRAGRPLLLVPPKAETLEVKRVVLGWKDTREARRAAFDALPLMRLAEKVLVASVAEDRDYEDAHAQAGDVVKWLGRHGISAETRWLPAVSEAALQLDSLAWEEGADLIVAGGYGHSRMREWILGGVTRDFIMKVPRCTLLSH